MNISSLYQFLERAYSSVPYYVGMGRAFPPIHYFLEVTRRCNLRCEMCQYINWLRNTPGAEQSEGELTTEEWMDVIDQTNRFSIITFTGGEPWVRKDFLELLEHASKNRRTHFISNGVMLNEDRASHCVGLSPKRLGGVGLNFVGISLEGPAELHDRIVNMDGAFDKAISGIKAIVEHREKSSKKAPRIHITVVVQKENVDKLPEMVKISADAGADILNFTLENCFNNIKGFGKTDPCTI